MLFCNLLKITPPAKLLSNRKGQGSLIGVIIGGVLLSTIVASATSWYLTMRNNLGNTEDKLEAQTIAQSEWERLSHMSLDELEANRNTFKTPYSAGTGSQFSISVNLGEKGTFNNGTCGNVSGGYANCFKNTTITVYRDGNRMFTTRTLPLMAGDYTRKEVDNLLASMKNDYTTKINNLSNKLSNDYYNKSQIDSKFNNLIKLENVDNNAKIPEGKALYAYLNGQKLPLSSSEASKGRLITRIIDNNYRTAHGNYGWMVENMGTIGSFTISKPSVIIIDWKINFPSGYSTQMALHFNEREVITSEGIYGYDIGTKNVSGMTMLNPGTYTITLYGDGDNQGPARLNSEIISIYCLHEIDSY